VNAGDSHVNFEMSGAKVKRQQRMISGTSSYRSSMPMVAFDFKVIIAYQAVMKSCTISQLSMAILNRYQNMISGTSSHQSSMLMVLLIYEV